MPLPPLLVAAVALVRDRRVLMVTARDRDVYYMPGGKIDPGETAAQGAAREAREEVSLALDPDALTELFEVRTQAHGEPDGREVHMRVFRAETDAVPGATIRSGSRRSFVSAACSPVRRSAVGGRS